VESSNTEGKTYSFVSSSGHFRQPESNKGQRNSSQDFLLPLRQSNEKNINSFNRPLFDNI